VAGELRIVIDGVTELFVVDVLTFAADGASNRFALIWGRGDA
jgi:hypothetical protein